MAKDVKEKDSIAVGGSAKGRSLASDPASARAIFPLQPCPQLKQIPESGPRQMLPTGPAAPPKDQGTLVHRSGGVTVGRPQGALNASIPDTKTDGGKSVTWKPSLHVSDKEEDSTSRCCCCSGQTSFKESEVGELGKTFNRQLE